MDLYERLKQGEPIDQKSKDFKEILWPETVRSRIICQKINSLSPFNDETVAELTEELFEHSLPVSSRISPPFQIDRGHCVSIGERVFINEGLDVMAAGSISIEDDVLIGPQVTILTSNHDYRNHSVLRNKPVVIKKNAWICSRAVICPGVTVGENAVVAAGAVVTKDVMANTLVGGNPARFIKEI